MTELLPIRRALVSVYDKTRLVELGQALAAAGVEIVSTGSTAARLAEAGVAGEMFSNERKSVRKGHALPFAILLSRLETSKIGRASCRERV